MASFSSAGRRTTRTGRISSNSEIGSEASFRLAEFDAERESERRERVDRARQVFERAEDAERDRLARLGILPGADFGADFKAAMLPEVTPGISDTGGMVLKGLREQGQAGVQSVYDAIPGTVNRLFQSKGVSGPYRVAVWPCSSRVCGRA
jgi:hypothetical protein